MTVGTPTARAYPHSVEAERALLGAVVQRPDLLDRLPALEGLWYRPEHEALWGLIVEMRDRAIPIDLVTLPEMVIRRGPARFGGVAYVAELPDWAPAVSNAVHYARIVADHGHRRQILAACEAAMALAYAGEVEPAEVVVGLLAALDGVAE
jgi:replicative DNA helicase